MSDLTKPNRDLNALYLGFVTQVVVFLDDWNKLNPEHPAQVFEGYRTFERQGYLYSLGRKVLSTSPCYHKTANESGPSGARPPGTCFDHPLGGVVTNAPAGGSYHNYGLAVDVVFDADPVKPGPQWTWDGKKPWKKLGLFGSSRGLEWAGLWRRFPEAPHFQNSHGLQVTEALELHRRGGLKAVWDSLGIARHVK